MPCPHPMRVEVSCLAIVLSLLWPLAATSDERTETYRDAHRAFSELRATSWLVEDAVSEAAILKGKRQELAQGKARQRLAAAQTAADKLRQSIKAMEKQKSWQQSTEQFVKKLKEYETRLKSLAQSLAAIESAKKPAAKQPAGPTVDQPLGEGPTEQPPGPTVDLPWGKEPAKPAPKYTDIGHGNIDSAGPGAGLTDADGSFARRPPPHVPLDKAVVQWELKEMSDELRMWNSFFQAELIGEGLLARAHQAFDKHGATRHYAQTWAMWLGHYNHSGLSTFGHWLPLLSAAEDFQSVIRHASEITPEHRAYLRYLRGAMKIWRKDVRRKSRLMLDAIQLMARLAKATEDDNKQAIKQIEKSYKAVNEEIQKKPPFQAKKFDAWRSQRIRETRELAKSRTRLDKSTLSEHDLKVLIESAKKKLAAKGLPTKWLDDVLNDPPTVTIDVTKNREEKAGGLYYEFSNDVVLPSHIDVANPTDGQLAALVHELFHNWYDTTPPWYDLWLNQNEEETVATYLGYAMYSFPVAQRIEMAVKYGVKWGGDAGDSLTGLKKVHEYFAGEQLLQNFLGPPDAANWERLKNSAFKGHDEQVAALETLIRKPAAKR